MSLPLPPPPLLLPVQSIYSVSSHVHYVKLPKNYKALSINPNPSRGNRPAICVSSDSLETSSYTIKSLPVKLEDDIRKITFDYMHLEVLKVGENKFVSYLVKHRALLS
jgi:hypothetical protein